MGAEKLCTFALIIGFASSWVPRRQLLTRACLIRREILCPDDRSKLTLFWKNLGVKSESQLELLLARVESRHVPQFLQKGPRESPTSALSRGHELSQLFEMFAVLRSRCHSIRTRTQVAARLIARAPALLGYAPGQV